MNDHLKSNIKVSLTCAIHYLQRALNTNNTTDKNYLIEQAMLEVGSLRRKVWRDPKDQSVVHYGPSSELIDAMAESLKSYKPKRRVWPKYPTLFKCPPYKKQKSKS